MTNSKISSQSIHVYANTKSSSDSNIKSKNTSNDFTSIMDNSLKTKKTVSSNDNYQDKKAVNKSSDSDVSKNEVTKKVDNTASSSIKKDMNNVSSETKENTNSVTDTDNVTDTNNSEVVTTESVLEKVKELFTTIENKLTEILNITKEELEKHLELLGLTMFDMLNINNIQQLVLNVHGAGDITDVLTNESLANTLSSLTQEVEQIGQGNETNLSVSQLNELLNQAINNTGMNNDEYGGVSGKEDINQAKAPEVQVYVEKDGDNNSASYKESSNEESNAAKENNNLDTIINNLSGINSSSTLSFTDGITKTIQIREIVSQIVEQIKIIIKPEQTSMELQLNPENLGKLQLSIVSKEGVLTAQFNASSQVVKEALESQMAFLKDNLTNQGLKVEAIEVTVSNFEFSGSNQAQNENNNQGNSKKRRFLHDDVIEVNHVSEDSVAMDELNVQNGATVDYSA